MGIFSRSLPRKKLAIKTSRARPPLLPAKLQGFLARRITDIAGGAFIFTALVFTLALGTYDAKDPSLNTAGADGPVRNALGTTGSYVADILLQTLGFAAWLFALTFLAWGYRVLTRKPLDNLRGRIPALLAAVLFATVALARFSAPTSFGVGAGLGGSIGALVFSGVAGALQRPLGQMSFVFTTVAAFSFCVAFSAFALGFTPREWVEGMKRGRTASATAAAIVARAVDIFSAWHEKYSSHGEGAAPARVRRASLKEEVASQSAAPLDAGALPLSIIPRRKPVVTPRAERPAPKAEEKQKKLDLRAAGEEWQFPPLDILADPPVPAGSGLDEAGLQKNAELLHATLNDFGVQGDILKVSPGPIVTLYEMEPAPGTKTSRVVSLADDIARSMSAVSARIAAVPGKNAIGIELPNAKRETVYLKELLASRDYEKTTAKLPLVLGKNIAGDPVVADLARMPHLLVAGTTGSGKSVAVNTMILSLLYRLTPEQCRFIMIDPKMLELSVYDDIPHLLTPVVTEPHKAIISLKWAVREMEDRYRAMSKVGVRNIDGFNDRVRAARTSGEVLMHRVQTGFDADTGKPVYEEQPIALNDLPHIVIIVDEFADLMLVAGKEVENAIQRLAQMARAAGIHLIMATQRPSVDVITGVIKANFPTRISFQVTSKIDSRTILGDGGAEQLLGQGDMLYMAAGGRLSRVHGPFCSDSEVEKAVEHLRRQGAPNYVHGVTEDEEQMFGDGDGDGGEADALYDQAVALVLQERKASTSFIQRKLQIGYNRAARIIERMEKEGVVTAGNHVGKRDVIGGDNYGT
jgi:S-DNA-T family DNA segregation ATPase FtsK/SpoIIIE